METVKQLVVDAWRSLRRSFGTTLTASLLLGAGFAISLVVASIAATALTGHGNPIPANLEALGERDAAGNVTMVRGPDLLALRDIAPEALADVAAARSLDLSFRAGERNHSVKGALVDGPLFSNLGWQFHLGRDFQPSDAQSGAVILSDELWRRHFGSNPAILGQQVIVDGRAQTVIGVLPPFRSYPFHEQLYVAHRLDAQSAFFNRYWDVNVRVETVAQRERLLAALATQQAERERVSGDAAKLEPLGMRTIQGNGVPAESQVLIRTLMIMGGLLLVLASSNAGGLLLVHWLARSRELATRTALGGSRGRLLGTCLLQAGLLVSIALVFAHLLAAWILRVLEHYLHHNDNGVPQYARLLLDPAATWPVLVAAAGCVLVVAAPVLLRLRRSDLQNLIRSGERGNSRSGVLGSGLFALQCLLGAVTLLLTLLCALGARQMINRPSGLDTAQVLTARFQNTDPVVQENMARKLRDALVREPDLQAVSISGSLPLTLQSERRVKVGKQEHVAGFSAVDSDFASVYGLKLEAGEWLSADQVDQAQEVAVLDRSAADQLFPDGDALGASLSFDRGNGELQRYTVIGIVSAVLTGNTAGADQSSVFVPMDWRASAGLVVAVRTRSADPLAFQPRLQQLADATDPALALIDLRSFAQVQHASGAGFRLVAMLFGPLGTLAVLLAATGLAALLGSLVARRLRELGIRRALGAHVGGLLRPLLLRLSLWGGAGLLLGMVLGWPLARGLNDGLFNGGVLGFDTALITLSVLALALLTAAIPAIRRALRVDPMVVLREE